MGFAWLGTPYGRSYVHNLPWYAAFETELLRGALYPRHLTELWFGLGGLDFFFYGPAPFWLTAALGRPLCVGCEPGTVFALGGAWLYILSGPAFYAFARRWFAPWPAAAAALVYALAPYHFVFDWFYRQAVGEAAAYIFLPLAAKGFVDLAETRTGGRLFAGSVAGLALCHLPSLLFAIHLFGILFVLEAWRTKWVLDKAISLGGRAAVWGGAGLALSAVYWLPAIGLLDDVAPEVLFSAYSSPEAWIFLDGAPEPAPETTGPVKMMLICAILVCAAALFGGRRTPAALRLWIAAPLAFAVFLMTPGSMLIWQYWILSTVQFPWRAMMIVDLSTALAAGVLIAGLQEAMRARIAAALGAACLVVAVLAAIPPALDAIRAGQALEAGFEPGGAVEYFPTEFDRAMGPAVREREAFNFAARRELIGDIAEAGRAKAGGYTIVERRSRRTLVDLDGQRDTVLVVMPYWRHWRARDGETGAALPTRADPELGLMVVDVDPSTRQVDLALPWHWTEWLGLTLSLSTALILAAGLARRARRSSRHKGFVNEFGRAWRIRRRERNTCP